MTESVILARRVRAALAAATTATLFIDGYDADLSGGASCDEITLTDPGGLPTLLCVSPSLLGAAARRNAPAVLTVAVLPAGDEPAGSAVFVGQPSDVGQQAVAGHGLDVVELTPMQISVEDVVTAECGPTPRRRQVLLEDYGVGRPLRCAARQLQQHLECRHGERLRAAAARLAASTPAAIAAARVEALDADGADLVWVDGTGAHRRRLPFPRRARTGRELADLLRDQLERAGDRP